MARLTVSPRPVPPESRLRDASHLLNEVEQGCDSVAILSKGKVVAQGAVADLLDRQSRLRIRTTDDARATHLLDGLPWVGGVAALDGALVVSTDPARAADVSQALAAGRVLLRELVALETSLEEYFLQVTDEADG